MVMPLVDEALPRCRVCGAVLADAARLREHLSAEHGERQGRGAGPAPGDVTAF